MQAGEAAPSASWLAPPPECRVFGPRAVGQHPERGHRQPTPLSARNPNSIHARSPYQGVIWEA